MAAGGVRAQQRERSRATLVDEGARLFAAHGYAAVGLAEIVRAAGVTKGALYHHFDGKQDLFRAVYEAEGRRLSAVVSEAYHGRPDPLDAFHAGVGAFLEALLDPQVQRIMLIDAPGALGMQSIWRQLSDGGFIAQIQRGLDRAVDAGALPGHSVEPLAHLSYGAVCAAAQLIAHSADQRGMLREVLASLRLMLDAVAGRTGRS
jgi:AcrR family transcriptional regulator